MTIDEAIRHCEEVAEKNECKMTSDDGCTDVSMKKCAADHRQLAEWLTELKEAKRLLKAAVKDFAKLVELTEYNDERGFSCIITDKGHHDECPLNDGDTCGWRYADEALKLIGDD